MIHASHYHPITSIHSTFETDLTQFEREFTDCRIACFSALIKDYSDRLAAYKQDPELLRSGLFYARNHFLAIKDIKELQPLFHKLLEGRHYYRGYRNPKYFTCVGVEKFRPNQGYAPSVIVESYKKGLTLTDCAQTFLVSIYDAFRKTWGDQKFDAVFALDSKTPLEFYPKKDSLAPFLHVEENLFRRYLPGHFGRRKIQRGLRYYIKNIPSYLKKHYNGDGQGINVLCISDEPGNQKFIGFGLSPEGVTEEEILDFLIRSYNAPQNGMQIIPKSERINFFLSEIESKPYKNHQIRDLNDFLEQGGGKFKTFNETFKIDRIFQIHQTSMENVRKVVDRWL